MAGGDALEKLSEALASSEEAELRLVIIELKSSEDIDTIENTLKNGHVVLLKIAATDATLLKRAIERARGVIKNSGGEIVNVSDTPLLVITPGIYVRVIKV